MRQPKRSRIVGDNPGRSEASFDPTSRHLTSGQEPALPPANTAPQGLPTATADFHPTCVQSAAQLADHCHGHGRPNRAATCLGSRPRRRTAHFQPGLHAVQCYRARLTIIRYTNRTLCTSLYENKITLFVFYCDCHLTILQYPTLL